MQSNLQEEEPVDWQENCMVRAGAALFPFWLDGWRESEGEESRMRRCKYRREVENGDRRGKSSERQRELGPVGKYRQRENESET